MNKNGINARACVALFILGIAKTHAAQTGPVFPTHRFPTDQSFHLSFQPGYMTSNQNFVGSQATEALPNGAKISLQRQSILAEYQPDRSLSAGLLIRYDSLNFSDELGANTTKKGFGDQRFFAEYRVVDKPGISLGSALLIKFPLYTNPSYESLVTSRTTSVALLGDAQSDFSILGTSEYWATNFLRLRADFGYTYRTERFSAEYPILLSAGFVTPRIDIEFKFLGNLSRKNDSFDSETVEVDVVRTLFGNSQYAYAKNPWAMSINPTAEIWINSNWALNIDYKHTLIGLSAPKFWELQGGLIYRWSKTEVKNKKRVREVDISTDQEAGYFPGEEKLRQTEKIETSPAPQTVAPTEEQVPPDEESQ